VSFEPINQPQTDTDPTSPEFDVHLNRPLADQVTVVLLTFNCGHRLGPVLDRLRGLGLPTIAIDNASADDTVNVLRGRGDLEVIALPANIGAAGRNHGVQRAETPYVLFCDDDGWWQPEGLPAAVALLEAHPRLAVLNARILVGEQGRLDAISMEMADSPLPERVGIPGAVLMSFMGGAVLIRRAAYLEVRRLRPRVLHGRRRGNPGAQTCPDGVAPSLPA